MPSDPGTPEEIDPRLARLDLLRSAERRAAISRVASVIAHLIGTPLHVIAGRAALIRANPTPENAVENARRIEEQVDKLAQRIRKLIDYLTSPEPDTESRSVADVVTEALSLYEPIARQKGVELIRTGALLEEKVEGNSSMLILTSLFSLAVRLAPARETVELVIELLPDHNVAFELSIPGFAVPTVPIDRLDPPESDERASAEPLQVLSVCHAIARRSGGRLEVVARDGRPTAIRFECPGGP
jgi:signal transduction histidine kinase